MSVLSRFIVDVVIENGGDAEQDAATGQLQVIVPEVLRDRLSLPDQWAVVSEDNPSGDESEHVPLGYGAELLERAVSLALDTGRTAAVRMPEPPSRKRVGDILDRQLTFLNTTYKLLAEQKSWCDYWLWTFNVIAEADERHEMSCHVCISAGGAVCASLPELLHERAGDWSELNLLASERKGEDVEASYVAAVGAAISTTERDLADFRTAVKRHHARDAKRIGDYFEELREEMELEIRRRDLKGDKLQIRREKQVALREEESAKLAALKEKYRIRLAFEPRALLLARLPVTRCDLLIKRRKGERRISANYNLLSKRMDPLVCEGCGASTVRPGFCDSKRHLLCEDCLSRSGGRGMPECPGCKGKGPPTSAEMMLKHRGIRQRRSEEKHNESAR
jgi:hypothetical protein